MTNSSKIILIIILIAIAGIFWFFTRGNGNSLAVRSGVTQTPNLSERDESGALREFKFKNKGLNTNTAKASIPLDKVLDGGPGKDGIPALTNPKFVSIKEAEKDIEDDINGLVVSVGDTVKFYPYSILVWHEIANDIVGGKPLVVTFCPLCGSAIVFNAEINGKTELFGVSGKLFESNLLMYDFSTESLWSQSIGTAVVGDRTGEKLTLYPSQVLPFKTVKRKWPNAQVLSVDTGFSRNYDFYPYGDYDSNDDVFFPISVRDNRFPPKDIMFVVNIYEHYVAFPLKQLGDTPLKADVDGKKVTAVTVDGEIIVKDNEGNILPGFNEMWFSWATQHQEDGIVAGK